MVEREAVEAHLGDEIVTFGAALNAFAPSRDDWHRG